jgi:hypothetical protein
MKHVWFVLVTVFIIGCKDSSYFLKTYQERIDDSVDRFAEYKDIDLSTNTLNCKELTELKVGLSRLPFDVVDFEYHEKYSFQQCRSEINLMIIEECNHNISANFYYEQSDVFTSERTNYFCSEKINETLNENILSKNDIEQLLLKPLVNLPSYSSFINLRMVKTISAPKQKLKKGFYAVRIDIGDSLDEKYFIYFNDMKTANYFIDKVGVIISKN